MTAKYPDSKENMYSEDIQTFSRSLFEYIKFIHKGIHPNYSKGYGGLHKPFTENIARAVRVTVFILRNYITFFYNCATFPSTFESDTKRLCLDWLAIRENVFVKVLDTAAFAFEANLIPSDYSDIKEFATLSDSSDSEESITLSDLLNTEESITLSDLLNTEESITLSDLLDIEKSITRSDSSSTEESSNLSSTEESSTLSSAKMFKLDVNKAIKWFIEIFQENLSDEFFEKGGWQQLDKISNFYYRDLYNNLKNFVEYTVFEKLIHSQESYKCVLIKSMRESPIYFPIPKDMSCLKCKLILDDLDHFYKIVYIITEEEYEKYNSNEIGKTHDESSDRKRSSRMFQFESTSEAKQCSEFSVTDYVEPNKVGKTSDESLDEKESGRKLSVEITPDTKQRSKSHATYYVNPNEGGKTSYKSSNKTGSIRKLSFESTSDEKQCRESPVTDYVNPNKSSKTFDKYSNGKESNIKLLIESTSDAKQRSESPVTDYVNLDEAGETSDESSNAKGSSRKLSVERTSDAKQRSESPVTDYDESACTSFMELEIQKVFIKELKSMIAQGKAQTEKDYELTVLNLISRKYSDSFDVFLRKTYLDHVDTNLKKDFTNLKTHLQNILRSNRQKGSETTRTLLNLEQTGPDQEIFRFPISGINFKHWQFEFYYLGKPEVGGKPQSPIKV